ncbi:MAG: HNH endonuclease signature motif containing protein [Pseudoclavibacter sp.]
MQNEPVDDEVPQAAVPGRAARLREVRRRLAACTGVELAVVDSACQRAEDVTVEERRSLLMHALADNQRQLNRLHGEQSELHARALGMGLRSDELAGTSSPAVEVRSLAGEIGAVVGRSKRSVQIEFGRADAMANLFEPVSAAMMDGKISRAHALVIVDAGLRIVHPDPAELERRRAEFSRVVLEKAVSTTPGRVTSLAARVAEELTEEPLDERFERARRTRRVTLAHLDDGLGELAVIDSYAKLRLIFDRTTRQARVISDTERRAARTRADSERQSGDLEARVPTLEGHSEALESQPDALKNQSGTLESKSDAVGSQPGDPAAAAAAAAAASSELRSLDEVRADVLSDSFLRATPEELKARDPIKAKISVIIPAETLLAPGESAESASCSSDQSGSSGPAADLPRRLSPAPALLDGHIPVPTAEVRRLIDAAPELERIFTDPIKGTLLEVDTYRPTSAMRRRLAVRDGRCRFVGCMMPANRCDIDHTEAWEEGGSTSLQNLGHLCGSDHTGKHHGDWAVEQLPGGIYEWRSPTGFAFRDEPVQFGRLTSLPPSDHGEQRRGTDPPEPGVPREPHDPRGPRAPVRPRDDDRRARFPKIGFLEEFRRERAAKKAAAEAESTRKERPEFRPSENTGSSHDPPPF